MHYVSWYTVEHDAKCTYMQFKAAVECKRAAKILDVVMVETGISVKAEDCAKRARARAAYDRAVAEFDYLMGN